MSWHVVVGELLVVLPALTSFPLVEGLQRDVSPLSPRRDGFEGPLRL